MCLKELDTKIIPGEDMYDLLLDMVDRHPNREEMLHNDIIFEFVTKNNKSPSFKDKSPIRRSESFRSYYKDKNGFWKSFSLLGKCVSGKGKTPHYQFMSALRFSIDDHIKDFRKEADYICSNCNGGGYLDVDHVTEFKTLVDDFTENNGICEVVKVNTHYELSDEVYKGKWRDYHKNNCSLQYLCVDCHLYKTRDK
jgi:hypothetical protein